jgi:Flp pilus assembly protein TadD
MPASPASPQSRLLPAFASPSDLAAEDFAVLESDAKPDLDRDIAAIWTLNREGKSEEAIAAARALVAQYPDEPRAHFEYAGALDYQGREAEAIAPYRQAQALGLSGDDIPRLYVQLGSTLRNVGELDEAVRFLEEGRSRFPDHAGIRTFLALALVSAGRCREAVVTLLDLIAANAAHIDLDGYDRALREYTDELRHQDS